MQSLSDLNSSERGFNYPIPLPSPSYIQPKDLLTDEIEFEEIHEFNDVQQSELPKFVSLKQVEVPQPQFKQPKVDNEKSSSMIFRETAAKYLMASKLGEEETNVANEEDSSSFMNLLKSIIWICYFSSTAQSQFQTLSLLSFVNFIGTGLAIFVTLVKIVKNSEVDFQGCLHLMSLATTITLFLFSSFDNPESSFVWALIVIRSFRLFFPLNLNYSFKKLIIKYSKILKRILKISAPLLFLLTLFSLIFSEGTYSNIFNRCRQPYNFEKMNSPVDNFLCGSRQCPANLECLNPKTYNIIPDESQFKGEGALAYGFFIFTNFYRSIFSVFSLGTLSQSALIIDIYVNTIPGYLMAWLSILVLIFIQFSFIPVLIVLIESRLEQQNEDSEDNIGEKSVENMKQRISLKHSCSNQPEVYNAAPTFGRINNESISSKTSKKAKTRVKSSQSEKKISINGELQEPIKELVKFQEIPELTHEQESKSKQSKEQATCEVQEYLQKFMTIIKVTVAVVQFLLMLIFSLKIVDGSTNQAIGIGLCCIFILWSFQLGLEIINKYFDEQEESETDDDFDEAENSELVFKIECFIYATCLLDYFCRILQGVYFMEDVSSLTPLATASLTLRILYIPLISGKYPSFCNNLKIFAKMQNSIFIYVLFMVVVAGVFSTLTMNQGNSSFSMQIVKHLSALANSNWIEIYRTMNNNIKDGGVSDNLEFAIKFFLVIIGEFILLKFIYSEAISTGILNSCSSFVELPEIQLTQTPTQQDILAVLKSQKTFFLLSYEPKSIRESLHKIIQRNTYRNFKRRLIEVYVLISFVGEIVIKNTSIYVYSLMTITCILLIDALISIIALRFWGKYSFSNYRWYSVVNLMISFIIIVSAVMYHLIKYRFFFDISPLRSFRILLLFSMNVHLKEGFRLIVNFFRIVVKLLPLVVIFWAFFTIISVCITMEYHEDDKTQFLFKSLSFGLQMFKKGFDLPFVLLIQNDFGKIFSLQSLLFTIMIGIPFNCLCIVIIFKSLQKEKKIEEEIKLKQIQRSDSFKIKKTKASVELQKIKIKSEILGIIPKVNPVAFQEKGFFLTLVTQTQLFNSFKMVILGGSAFFLIFLTLFKTVFSSDVILYLKFVRTFFYLMEIFLFIIESIAYKCQSKHFKLTLGLYLLSFPGSFITMVPFHKLQASKGLNQLLYLFVSMVPLSLVNIFLSFSNEITSLVIFTYRKLYRTCWILFLVLCLCWFFASTLSIFLKEEMIVIMSKVFVCFLGGTLQFQLPKNTYTKYDQISVFVIVTIINFVTFPIRNGLFAVILFEISDKINLKYQKSQIHTINRRCFRQDFDQYKFLQTWYKLDPKGTGVLPYSIVFHNILHFIKSFKLYRRYLNYLVASRSQLFEQKLQLFRQLSIPVRTINMTDSSGNKKTQYMITIFDLVAHFFCLTLKEKQNNFWNPNDPKIIEEEPSSSVIFDLELDTSEWTQDIAKRIEEFNSYRKQQLNVQQKYIVLKAVDMESRFLGSIIKIMPALRRKISQAQEKVKKQ